MSELGVLSIFLFQVIRETEISEGNVVVWDFQNRTFFHPFFIAPLSIYKQMNGKTVIYKIYRILANHILKKCRLII